MKLILDTNILISALIRSSVTRKIIFLVPHQYYYPQESLKEIEKHRNLILKKARISEGLSDFNKQNKEISYFYR